MNKERRKKLNSLLVDLRVAKRLLEEISLEEFEAATARVGVDFQTAHEAADILHSVDEDLGAILNSLEDLENL